MKELNYKQPDKMGKVIKEIIMDKQYILKNLQSLIDTNQDRQITWSRINERLETMEEVIGYETKADNEILLKLKVVKELMDSDAVREVKRWSKQHPGTWWIETLLDDEQ